VPSPFPTGIAGSSLRTPSPTKLPKSFHPPVDSLPLRSTSFSDPHRAAPTFKPVRVGCTFLGVRVPSSRHQPTVSLPRQAFQLPTPSVPGVPPASDDFHHDLPCEFISPRSRLQDSLFKGFPCHTATKSCRPRFAFVSVPPRSLYELPRTPLARQPPSRRCSMWKSVVRTLVFSRCPARSLLEFSLFQVLLSPSSPRSLTPASAHRLMSNLSSHPRHRRTAF
jgi:hypothetical protein